MPDYNKSASTALAMIKRSGKAYSITRSRPAFDDVTGEPSTGTTLTGTIFAVVLSRYKGMVFDSLDDGLKEACVKGQARSLIAAAKNTTFKPEALDEISIAGSQWQVVGCSELNPAGIPILYTIGVVQK